MFYKSILALCAAFTFFLTYAVAQQSIAVPRNADEAYDWLSRCSAKEHYGIFVEKFLMSIEVEGEANPTKIVFFAIQSTRLTNTNGQWRLTVKYAEKGQVYFDSRKRENLELCKGGLDFLIEVARTAQREADAQDETAVVEFRKQVKLWRDQAVKPTMPETAYPHKVLAENAFKEKNIDKAIKEYRAGLDIFPYWPEGHFNLALLVAEQGHYRDATLHMRYYLELVPDAPDAEAAKNKIIIWQDKLNDQRLRGELP